MTPTPPEIRAAAERVQSIYSGGRVKVVYADFGPLPYRQYELDRETIIDAYLSEHHDADGERKQLYEDIYDAINEGINSASAYAVEKHNMVAERDRLMMRLAKALNINTNERE